eukprot:g66184.t1
MLRILEKTSKSRKKKDVGGGGCVRSFSCVFGAKMHLGIVKTTFVLTVGLSVSILLRWASRIAHLSSPKLFNIEYTEVRSHEPVELLLSLERMSLLNNSVESLEADRNYSENYPYLLVRDGGLQADCWVKSELPLRLLLDNILLPPHRHNGPDPTLLVDGDVGETLRTALIRYREDIEPLLTSNNRREQERATGGCAKSIEYWRKHLDSMPPIIIGETPLYGYDYVFMSSDDAFFFHLDGLHRLVAAALEELPLIPVYVAVNHTKSKFFKCSKCTKSCVSWWDRAMGNVICYQPPYPYILDHCAPLIGYSFIATVSADERSARGRVIGTDVYNWNSKVSSAAIHAGLLKVGETKELRITIVPELQDYEASFRNGIQSNSSTEHWSVSSFRLSDPNKESWLSTVF